MDQEKPEQLELNKLHQGIPLEVYLQADGLSSSALKKLKRSPMHLHEAATSPPTEALRFGSLVHRILQDKKSFLACYRTEPVFTGLTKDGKESTRSGEAKIKKAAWYNDLPPDAIVVKPGDSENILGIMNAVERHGFLKEMLIDGVSECSLWVDDPETGVRLKCRPDYITKHGFVVDFKTTQDARPNNFLRDIFDTKSLRRQGYIIQAAHYAHCLRVAGIGRGDSFTFVAIEKEPPFGIMIYPMDIGCLGPGEQFRSVLTALYKQCRDTNKWPGYPEAPYPVTVPEWVEVPGEEQ